MSRLWKWLLHLIWLTVWCFVKQPNQTLIAQWKLIVKLLMQRFDDYNWFVFYCTLRAFQSIIKWKVFWYVKLWCQGGTALSRKDERNETHATRRPHMTRICAAGVLLLFGSSRVTIDIIVIDVAIVVGPNWDFPFSVPFSVLNSSSSKLHISQHITQNLRLPAWVTFLYQMRWGSFMRTHFPFK